MLAIYLSRAAYCQLAQFKILLHSSRIWCLTLTVLHVFRQYSESVELSNPIKHETGSNLSTLIQLTLSSYLSILRSENMYYIILILKDFLLGLVHLKGGN